MSAHDAGALTRARTHAHTRAHTRSSLLRRSSQLDQHTATFSPEGAGSSRWAACWRSRSGPWKGVLVAFMWAKVKKCAKMFGGFGKNVYLRGVDLNLRKHETAN